MFSMTLPGLYSSYATGSKAIRMAVSEMGLDLVVCGRNCSGCDSPLRYCADTVTAIKYPPNVTHNDFSQLMHKKYGISIAGTYGELAESAFRVGPTGLMQLGPQYTLNLLCCMGMTLREIGFPANVERALVTANAHFESDGDGRPKTSVQGTRRPALPNCGRGSIAT